MTRYRTAAEIIRDLPTLLTEARKIRGLSFRKAAAQIGVPHSTLRRIELGDEYNASNLPALLTWLDTPPTPSTAPAVRPRESR